MKDLGLWSVTVEGGNVYFMYRNHTMGRFTGSEENARYMVACINAGLTAWSAIDDAVKAEEQPVTYSVISETSGKFYRITNLGAHWACSCPDYVRRVHDCKHIRQAQIGEVDRDA